MAPAPVLRSFPQAPLPDVLCFDPAYKSVELTLTCDACYDGIDIIVPAGQFVSRVSQADADAQALAWGESQLSCLPADPASSIPSWGDLTGGVAIARVDVYGAMGFEAAAFADSSRRMWCSFEPALDFCDGPDVEGVPTLEVGDRRSVRWRAEMAAGEFSYSKVDAAPLPAPPELFPAPVSGAVGVSISFDANARPCFAFQVGGNVELRRFVAGSPTTYTWPGGSPKLFFNGLLQRDTGLRDLVCYYVLNGRLCARLQRDNFGVEYLLVDAPAISGLGALAEITKTDRGSGMDISRNWLAARGEAGGFILLRSAPYPPWPFIVSDFGSQAIVIEVIDYFLAIIDCGAYVEPATQAIAIDVIDYMAVTVTINQPAELATQGIAIESIAYPEVVVQLGSYTDGAEQGIAIEGIAYPVVSVNAGTYSEPATQAIAIEGIDYATA